MNNKHFYGLLQKEIQRIDDANTAKRHERIIEGFTEGRSPKAKIAGKAYQIFNSNDYLGLRHQKQLKKAEHEASKTYGSGPGAVRFISGSLLVHRQLEQEIAAFHGRDDAMIFSSAFAANLATMFCLSQGLTKNSLVDSDVLIVSDALNHRSIIDGVRLTGLPKEQRVVFEHMNPESLRTILHENAGKYKRAIVVTDGVFSMLGEYQDLQGISDVISTLESSYPMGIVLVVDDAHGVGIAGDSGRGVEEITGARADILVGTFGKAFGSDGGYVVSNQTVIDYLRESAATYIYSNSISPGTAGAALAAVKLLSQVDGQQLLKKSRENTAYFTKKMTINGFEFATPSTHPIQPVLIGDTAKTKRYVEVLFEKKILVTNISYPVVPPGRDEIRVQLSAKHTREDIDYLVESFIAARAVIQ